MPVVPNGNPAWMRTVDFTDYDGHADKQNHLGQGVIDPLTDVGAEGYSRAMADAAACTRVAPFCELEILCSDSAPAAPTVVRAYMQTGKRDTSYAGDSAPSGFPSGARNGNGDITLTFASSYTDEYGVAGAFELQCPEAYPVSTGGYCTVDKLTATTVRVRAFSSAGSAVSNARFTFKTLSGA